LSDPQINGYPHARRVVAGGGSLGTIGRRPYLSILLSDKLARDPPKRSEGLYNMPHPRAYVPPWLNALALPMGRLRCIRPRGTGCAGTTRMFLIKMEPIVQSSSRILRRRRRLRGMPDHATTRSAALLAQNPFAKSLRARRTTDSTQGPHLPGVHNRARRLLPRTAKIASGHSIPHSVSAVSGSMPTRLAKPLAFLTAPSRGEARLHRSGSRDPSTALQRPCGQQTEAPPGWATMPAYSPACFRPHLPETPGSKNDAPLNHLAAVARLSPGRESIGSAALWKAALQRRAVSSNWRSANLADLNRPLGERNGLPGTTPWSICIPKNLIKDLQMRVPLPRPTIAGYCRARPRCHAS